MEVDNTNLTNPLAKRGLDFDGKDAVLKQAILLEQMTWKYSKRKFSN
jgi:hypothetical protein